jgi:nitroreductase
MKTELILEIIQERWSPVSFSSAPVEEFKLKAMFEAARFAPSSRNEQPWMFVYTTREDMTAFNTFLGFMEETNSIWAREAYALIISFARTKYKRNDKPNRFAFHDTGMAVTNLLLQALTFDIYVHQMGGYSVEKVKDYFRLGDGIEPVAMMAAGYLGTGENIPQEILMRDEERRPRKNVDEYTYRSSFSNPAFRSH